MNGGVVDTFLLEVIAWKAGDDRDVPEGDGELVGNDPSDAAIAIEKRVDTDKTVMKLS